MLFVQVSTATNLYAGDTQQAMIYVLVVDDCCAVGAAGGVAAAHAAMIDIWGCRDVDVAHTCSLTVVAKLQVTCMLVAVRYCG
jgi:hypothetical protein